MTEGYDGVMAFRVKKNPSRLARTLSDGKKALAGRLQASIVWDRDETMAAYL